MINNIQKIERALAFAKEVNLNDEQVKELMAMVLGLVNFKITVPWTQPVTTPNWPGQIGPAYLGDTIITYGVCEGGSILGQSCACSPRGQPHSDDCKAMGINA